MSLIRNSEIESIQGNEGTSIKQFFHPHNTLEGIGYSLAQFTLEPEKKSKLHKMKSSEIYYILEGKANLRIDDSTMELGKDDSAYVPPNAKQSIENIGDDNLRFLCIVEPAWKAEDEIILE
ncbi:Mannose-1-phosphate guanylyltransferase protein [Marine Group I thaumarchaeote SCGC AAA799-E16]|uniref:Mannose-1-phosphate guanylyltransferase protein n=4 Tax=Marine Group I TaxID=905826 RepID=A0A081RN89_9ARCH|nr:Mannose-1-phosphate guanylyltransferase protein [Marine Group I thaumarchaeote SCGC AAA799-N04]KER06639.1 Mannose-1-phosphate guanylyltransferase protein [Marine Group I thaumarchaeote SCGC AAA799-E16]KFM16048.1 Mannose-1-phosphate guanylyltransferase protein [Marine Group I thaumarchaeote SCGC AAA799-D11]KFM17785.1 Mannose-1-phosphate guanylyltransferase protein [Marine Group I thaumarchaeote SCGC RSA3]